MVEIDYSELPDLYPGCEEHHYDDCLEEPNLKDRWHEWQWKQLIKRLDEAGYRIVKKPEISKGVGKPRPYV